MVLTPVDIYPIMNKMVRIATGVENLAVVDTSSFMQAGETILQNASVENTLHALTEVLGETFFADRNYTAKLSILNGNSQRFTSRWRKISYYARENEATGHYNTNLNDSNLIDGGDNNSKGTEGQTGARSASMWKQTQPLVLEVSFGGRKSLQKRTTIYDEALRFALRDENEFARFVSGIMTEVGNDIESNKEAENRYTMLSYMAGLYDMNTAGTVINLTAEFNNMYGTSYTSEELRTVYLTEFLEFFVARIKILSDTMEYRSKMFHWYPVKTVGGVQHHLMRFTPKAKQKMVLYSPLFTYAKTKVFPEIFNPSYLSMDNYEGVLFWQSPTDGAKIKIKPNVLDKQTGASKAGNNVELDYVVGMIYDTDALMVNYQLDRVAETPLEAAHLYRNIIWHWSKQYVADYTENGVLLIMKD